jgi:hypothetical protein
MRYAAFFFVIYLVTLSHPITALERTAAAVIALGYLLLGVFFAGLCSLRRHRKSSSRSLAQTW